MDDGKSTLIGRLLYETKKLHADQLKIFKEENIKFGTQENKLDFSLLVDGLSAEREQGITIDVAYRFLTTKKRKMIIADTPGHEQYTRNMATGASTASIGILIVDARKGILKQTKRHSFILSLLGIKNIVLAINKLDLIQYDKIIYKNIKDSFLSFSKKLKFQSIYSIPISALDGDNIIKNSKNMTWYNGLSLINYLDNFEEKSDHKKPLRIPIQHVIRSVNDFRGYAGTIVSGEMYKNQKVKILPSGFNTTIKKIIEKNVEEEIQNAKNQKSVTFTLNDHIDISRGDFVVDQKNPCEMADKFRIDLIWMDKKSFFPGRTYFVKMECRLLKAKIFLKYKYDINNFTKLMSKTLNLNDIASCDIIFEQNVVYENYEINRKLGSFIVIDPETNSTCGAGIINYALRRSSNIIPQNFIINKEKKSILKNHKPCIIWFTGISGSGKSTIANILEQELYDLQIHTTLLDGDNIRNGLNKDLGFTDSDRIENIRRIGEVSKLMVQSGLVTIVSFISPFKSERKLVRDLVNKKEFIEVFVNTPLEIAEKRDPKGLYKKARSGKLPNFTGIDSPYEMPENPEIILETINSSPKECAKKIITYLKSTNFIFF